MAIKLIRDIGKKQLWSSDKLRIIALIGCLVSCSLGHIDEIFSVWQSLSWLTTSLRLVTTILALWVALSTVGGLTHKDSSQPDMQTIKAALEQRTQELKMATQLAMIAQQQVEQYSHSQKDFINLVSHELCNPLTALQLQIDSMVGRSPPPPIKYNEIMYYLQDSCLRMSTLVKSMIHHQQFSHHQVHTHIKTFHISTLLANIVEDMTAQAKQRNISLKLENNNNPQMIHTDFNLVYLVMSQLVSNAIKFTHMGDAVFVSFTYQREAWWMMSVQDSGPGIRQEEQKIIFEPFVHLETLAHKNNPGLGLGLSLARDAAKLLSGHLELQSTPGHGSLFSLVLPAQSLKPPDEGPESLSNNERLLLSHTMKSSPTRQDSTSWQADNLPI